MQFSRSEVNSQVQNQIQLNNEGTQLRPFVISANFITAIGTGGVKL